MGIEVEGLDQAVRSLDDLPAILDREARREADLLASSEVPRIKRRAASVGSQAALAARSVRSEGNILVGAAGTGVPAAIFYGAEFGGQRRPTTQQFKPFRGQQGYFMYPTIRDDDGRMMDAFDTALEAVERKWGQ